MKSELSAETMPITPFRIVFRLAVVVLFLTTILAGPSLAQTSANVVARVDPGASKMEATALRDAFVTRLRSAGFTCSIPVPAIVMEDVPSFGQYRSETNVVRTSDWNLLNPGERAMFVQLAGPGKDENDAHHLFEVAHQWIFIHELGHWWQACNGGNEGRSHYQAEYGANRIALSYWREVNPEIAETMRPVFQAVVDHAASPVPPDQSVENYFNANYETLGPSPKYPWFMSRMNLAAFDEKPAPTFAAALKSQQHSQ